MIHRELRVTVTPVPRPDKWVFVIGCYNSGTTLLSRILGRHPAISALPTEGQFLTDQLRADHELGLSRMWTRREDLYRLDEGDEGPDPLRMKKEWGMRLDTRRPVLLEKSPPNTARTRWLQRHFEGAHFVAVVRNGYAVVEGIRRKGRPRHLERWPIELCAHQWARSNEVIEQDSEFLERILWVTYEDLTRDTAATLDRIFGFLGLERDRGLGLDDRWSIHERHEPIRDMNAESLKRLSESDVRTINRVAGEALAHFGYEVLDPSAFPRDR